MGRGIGVTGSSRAGEQSIVRTQERLALLVRAGELFHRSLDLEETLSNIARMAVESFSDLCLFDLIDENTGRLYVSVAAHRHPEIEASLKALVTPLLQTEVRRMHPARRVALSGHAFFVPHFSDEIIQAHAASDEHETFMRRMGYRSKIVVPVTAQSEVFGALTFVRTMDEESFEPADVQAAEELGRRAGLAVANAKRYHREQHVAETLQRAFLNDELPRNAALQFHALYRGAQDDSALGGDWYDAFEAGRNIVMTVGDVMGKGVDAARMMVQLRQWVRLAAVVSTDPAQMLSLLNRAVMRERKNALATAFVGVIDHRRTTLTYASAGHPPPLLKLRSDGVVLLDGSDLPLGADRHAQYTTRRIDLGDAALLALYTDGLTEIDRDPIAGERHVIELMEPGAILHAANPARYLERALAGKRAGDDLAIMTVRFGSSFGHWRFDVMDSAAAYAIKRDFLKAVADVAGAAADLNACELIFGELVGNALRYAPGPLSLTLSQEPSGLVLHVMDEGPGFDSPPGLPTDVWSESGRGLFLVSALAEDVGIQRLPAYGSYVKVALPIHASRAA